MDQFETLMSKLGETGIQAILENWERHQGIKHPAPLPLECRWERFLEETAALSSFDA